MDPVTTAILAGIAAGAAAGAGEVSKQGLVDAYQGLKSLLRHKFGDEAPVVQAVTDVENAPDSKGRQIVLAEEVEKVGAEADPELVQAADEVQKQVAEQPGGSQMIQQIASGNYIAQATGGSSASVNVNQPRSDD